MPQIVTVGETMAAFTPGSTGFLRYVKNYEMRIAGAESNLAIGVSKLGHSAGWISCLGKDEFGEFVQNSIRAEGVDTSRVVFDPEYRTGIMFKMCIRDSYQPGHVLSDRTRTVRQGTSWLWRHVKRRFVPYEAYDKTE